MTLKTDTVEEVKEQLRVKLFKCYVASGVLPEHTDYERWVKTLGPHLSRLLDEGAEKMVEAQRDSNEVMAQTKLRRRRPSV